jgi:hypothetical protein
MSDLPEEVEEYFRHRDLDPAVLDDIPLTKQAFKDLSHDQLEALDMLNKLGKALEKDLKDGKHVKKEAYPEAAPADDSPTDDATPDQKVNTYMYAIH